jgi:hypothetical protein
MKGRVITVGMAYYLNHGMLRRHYDLFSHMDADVRQRLIYAVVDDGSPYREAFAPAASCEFASIGWRMGVDIPWNQDACRNIIVEHCLTDWVLLTDMDHMVPAETLRWCQNAKLDPQRVYTFARISEPELGPYKPHPNSWLMTRQMYLRAGGYDERFAGVYGTDGMFKKRVLDTAAAIVAVPHPLIRVPRDVTPDASTSTLERKTPEAARLKDQITAEIAESGDPAPKRLTFPYREAWRHHL